MGLTSTVLSFSDRTSLKCRLSNWSLTALQRKLWCTNAWWKTYQPQCNSCCQLNTLKLEGKKSSTEHKLCWWVCHILSFTTTGQYLRKDMILLWRVTKTYYGTLGRLPEDCANSVHIHPCMPCSCTPCMPELRFMWLEGVGGRHCTHWSLSLLCLSLCSLTYFVIQTLLYYTSWQLVCILCAQLEL